MAGADTPAWEDAAAGSRNRRLKILGQEEIEALYGRPHFSPEEREQYFALTPAEKEALDELGSLPSQITFILQLGYFKARHLFFVFSPQEVADDIQYIQAHYFSVFPAPDFTVSKSTRLKQQRLILAVCRYTSCDDQDRCHLEDKACEAARVSGKPLYAMCNTFSG
jgi:hypothetical protein